MLQNKSYLLFPPTFSCCTGSPHIALPLLNAAMKAAGFECHAIDLNREVNEYYDFNISEEKLNSIRQSYNLLNMNQLYFPIEDKINNIGNSFNGTWHPQTGFEYSEFSFEESESVRSAIRIESPFDCIFKTIAEEIIYKKPIFVGFSIAVPYQIIPAFQLCVILRELGYTGKIVFGGNVISRLISEFKLSWIFQLIDILVCFQGESTIVDLATALINNRNFGTIPNLVYQIEDAYITTKSSLIDLESIAAPDYRNLNVGKYWGINY